MKTNLKLLLKLLFLLPFTSLAQSVDLFSGQFNYTIPLGSISSKDLAVGLNLNYSGNSIRVTESEGNCGIGWSLSTGMILNREIRGLPDEMNETDRKGWLYAATKSNIQTFTPQADDNLSTSSCLDETVDWATLESIINQYQNDTEPDLFKLIIPEGSVEFIFDATGNIVTLTASNIKIEKVTNQAGIAFVVTSQRGHRYDFSDYGVLKSSKSYSKTISNELSTELKYFETSLGESFLKFYPVVFMPKTITSLISNEVAQFKYAKVSNFPNDGVYKDYLNIDSTNYILNQLLIYNLATITLGNSTIKINRSELDTDLQNGAWQRDRIVKTIEFAHQGIPADNIIFSYNFLGGLYSSKYLLRSIAKVANENCEKTASYSFMYSGLFEETSNYPSDKFFNVKSMLDWKHYSKQDYWGFPNNVLGNNNLSALYLYNTSDPRYRLSPFLISPLTQLLYKSGVDRNPNSSYEFGALNKIILPQGGQVRVEYEKNDFLDNGNLRVGPGIRVKELIINGGNQSLGSSIDEENPNTISRKVYEYKSPSNTSSGILLNPINLGFVTASGVKQSISLLGEYPSVVYSRVTEVIEGHGKIVYEFDVSGRLPNSTDGEWVATKSKIARKPTVPCKNMGHVVNNINSLPFAPHSNYWHKRGKLTRRIIFSELGTKVSETEYQYSFKHVIPGIVKALKFEKIDDVYYYSLYEIQTGRDYLLTTEVNTLVNPTNVNALMSDVINYSYNSKNLPDSITTILQDGTIRKKLIRYACDFPGVINSNASDSSGYAVKKLLEANIYSAVVEEVNKEKAVGRNEIITSSVFKIYRNFGDFKSMLFKEFIFLVGSTYVKPKVINNSFQYNLSQYKLNYELKEIDNNLSPLTVLDGNRNVSSFHYDVNGDVVVNVRQAKAFETVYDNFESISTNSLTKNEAAILTDESWTGKKAIRFTSQSGFLSSNNLIKKGASKYRISFWGKSNSAGKLFIEFSTNGTINFVRDFDLMSNDKWNYHEFITDIGSLQSDFSIKVYTNASEANSIYLDDFILVPSHARLTLSFSIYKDGLVSTTNDNGYSDFVKLDKEGRPEMKLDRFKNSIAFIQYENVTDIDISPLYAHFNPSVQIESALMVGDVVTFIPSNIQFGTSNQCNTDNLTYTWMVNDQAATKNSDNSLTYTFSKYGKNIITLIITNSFGHSAISSTEYCIGYDIDLNDFYADVLGPNGSIGSYDCNSVPQFFDPQIISTKSFPQECLQIDYWDVQTDYAYGNESTTYTAFFTVNSTNFKECSTKTQFQISGSKSATVTKVYRENCN